MKTFEEILIENRVFYNDEKTRRVIQAMKQACEQTVDKCAKQVSTELGTYYLFLLILKVKELLK